MDYCSAPKVLLLGISYPDVAGHMAQHNYKKDLLQHSELSIDQAVECVRRKVLTEMDGRDLARCVATEVMAGGGHEVYTVSKECGGIYRDDRHVYASFNNSRCMRRAMLKAFGKVQFQQVILDYYWMPTGWLVTRWNKTLFQETLPDLVKYNMLAYPGNRARSPRKGRIKTESDAQNMYIENTKHMLSNTNTNENNNNNNNNIISFKTDLELEEGVVFLPFCAHVCKELVGGIDILKPYYAITFVQRNELPGHALWKGTMAIDGKTMQHRLGKHLYQEEVYCTFAPKDIYENMQDAHVNKDDVMQMLLSIQDFDTVRMIRLRPLRQHEPPSVFRKPFIEPEEGGFIGLNWEMGRKRFKEYKRRGKGKKPVPLTPKAKKPMKSIPVVELDSASEVETDYGADDTEFDTDSDSSDDEDDGVASASHDPKKDFDPCDPENIPQTTHYFPYPALDIESYLISKDVINNDRVMSYYNKQWGPKSSRKKNKKQDIAKPVFQQFKKTQRDYLTRNPRLPPEEKKHEEGYRWTMTGDCRDEDANGSDDSDIIDDHLEDNIKIKRKRNRNGGGWELSLKGDDPEAHLVPKIIEQAKQDNEMIACRQLFEMKNPGFKTFSRSWVNQASFLSCYQIPKHSVLIKMDVAEKARKKLEAKKDGERLESEPESRRKKDAPRYEEYDLDSRSGNESVGAKKVFCNWSDINFSSSKSSALVRFADVAATAPDLSDDFRLLCEESKGLRFDRISEEDSPDTLPPFKPQKMATTRLPYDLSPHDNFLRDLFRLLQDAEDRILDHIICWQKKGRSFIVKDPSQFETLILSRCCENSNITHKSFLATLVSCGFLEIQIGKRRGGYRHNLFQRGKPKRLDQLIQERTNNLPILGGGDDNSVAPLGNDDVDGEAVDASVVTQEPPEAILATTFRKALIANLYQLLTKSKSLGLKDVIYWEESGESFKVHKLDEQFSTRVLKNYLSMDCYSRFKKELIDRGFKCKEGMKYGIFEHPKFVRGQRVVLDTLKEVKLKHRKRKTVVPEQNAADVARKQNIESLSAPKKNPPKDENETKANTAYNARKPKSKPREASAAKKQKIESQPVPKKHCSKDKNETELNAAYNVRKPKSKPREASAAKKQKIEPQPVPKKHCSKDKNETELNAAYNARKPKSKPREASAAKKQKTESRPAPSENSSKDNESNIGCNAKKPKSEPHEAPKDKKETRCRKFKYYELEKKFNLPRMLYTVLEEAKEMGFSEYIRWLPNGESFYVAEESLFLENFLHKHTRTRRFLTFAAWMVWLGFDKAEGENSGTVYKHQHFIRGEEDKLAMIKESLKFPQASRSCQQEQETPAMNSISTRKASKGITFPNASTSSNANGRSKRRSARPARGKMMNSEKIASESPGSDAVVSLEKEDSNLNLATGSVAISPLELRNLTPENYYGATNGSPRLPTERQLFSLSAVDEQHKSNKSSGKSHNVKLTKKAPKKVKRSSKQSYETVPTENVPKKVNGYSNHATPTTKIPDKLNESSKHSHEALSIMSTIHRNASEKSKLVPANHAGSETRSMDSSDRLKPRATSACTPQDNNKKRKIASDTFRRTKIPRNGASRKKRIVPETAEPPASRRSRRSGAGGARGASQERNVAPPSGRGLRSSTKVCGIDAINSMAIDSVSRDLLRASKCKFRDKKSSAARSILIEGKRHQLMPLSLPPDRFPAACSIDGQMMKDQFRLQETPRYGMEEMQVSSQVPTIHIEDAISIRTTTNTPNCEFAPIQESDIQLWKDAGYSEELLEDIFSVNTTTIGPPRESIVNTMGASLSHEPLEDGAISEDLWTNLLSAFSSRFGEDRANALKLILLWHVNIPVGPANEIQLLAGWISSEPPPNDANTNDKLSQMINQCLLVESCWFELSRLYGGDWSIEWFKKSLPIHLLKQEVNRICYSAVSNLRGVQSEMSVIIENHTRQKIQNMAERNESLLMENEKLRQEILEEHAMLEEEREKAKIWQRVGDTGNLNQQGPYSIHSNNNNNINSNINPLCSYERIDNESTTVAAMRSNNIFKATPQNFMNAATFAALQSRKKLLAVEIAAMNNLQHQQYRQRL